MEKRNSWTDGKAIAFTVFLFAGNLKADPRLSWLPIDLTVLAAAVSVLLMARMFVKNRFRIPVALFWVCGLFASFLLAVPWTEFTDYAVEKMIKLFSFTWLCAAAPLFLFKTEEDVRRLLNAIFAVAVLMAADAILSLIFSGKATYDNGSASGITAFGSNTIALGRTTGMALIWVAFLCMEKRMWLPKALACMGLLVIALVGSGSRGPLLSTFLVLAMTGVLFYWKKATSMGRFIGAILVVSLVCLYGFTIVPDEASSRIEEFVSGDFSNSELMRMKAYELSWEAIKETPEGTGWGGFATRINLWPDSTRQYPHNLVLEVFLEGGWLPGVFLCLVTGIGLWNVYKGAVSAEGRTLFALLIFVAGSAMVSGDINDNKEFFAFLGLALGFPGILKKRGEEHNERLENGAKEHSFRMFSHLF